MGLKEVDNFTICGLCNVCIWQIKEIINIVAFSSMNCALCFMGCLSTVISSLDSYHANLQEPILPGCFLRAKAIGLMPMIDQVFIYG